MATRHPPTASPPLRERLRQRTADEIERAALDLFLRHGYEATTIDQIADAAGISGRTFFRYFPTKEAVLFRDHLEKVERFRTELGRVDPNDGPVRRIRRALVAAERPSEETGLARARASLMAGNPSLRAYHASLVEEYERAIAAALLPPDPSLEDRVRAEATAGAVMGTLRALARVPAEPDPQAGMRLFAVAFDLLERMDRDPSPSVPTGR